MRLIDADALTERVEDSNKSAGLHLEDLRKIRRWIKTAPTIEPRHGLLIPDAILPRKGCYHCMFREGNLCRFLPASVPVVECGARHERHKECPLVEV